MPRWTPESDYDELYATLAAFEKEKVRYAVFGAVALNAHGLARATEGLDVFVEPIADNIESLRRALHSVFNDPSIDEINLEDFLGAYPALEYIAPEPASDFKIDILVRLGELFRYEDLATERVPFEDLVVTVVTPRQLYEMKRNTIRMKDRADAEALRRHFRLDGD